MTCYVQAYYGLCRGGTEFKAYAASTLLVLDLVGTFVFALSGGVAGSSDISICSGYLYYPSRRLASVDCHQGQLNFLRT